MPLDTQVTQQILSKFQRSSNDTGSPEVQIALLSARIKQLTPHFEQHVKDAHSRRGLQSLVNKRRKLVSYLKKTNPKAYEKLMKDLKDSSST